MTKVKSCSKCGILKHFDMFYNDKKATDGKRKSCKDCDKQYDISNRKSKNKSKRDLLAKRKLIIENNPYSDEAKFAASLIEKRAAMAKVFYLQNRDKLIAKQLEYNSKNNRSFIANSSKYKRERRMNDHVFCMRERVSCLVRQGLISRSAKKTGSIWKVLGYSPIDLVRHIESKFKDGMSWENRSMWHIDHIIPQSLFEFSSIHDDQFKRCWSLDNLQPLWANDNIRKSNNIL